MGANEPLAAGLLHLRVKHVDLDGLGLEYLVVRQIPKQKADRELARARGAVEVDRREDETAPIAVAEYRVAQALVVGGVDVLELGEQAQPCGAPRELAADAKQELREQLAARLAEVAYMHALAHPGHRHVGLVGTARAALLRRGEGRIDQHDPAQSGVGELVAQALRQLPGALAAKVERALRAIGLVVEHVADIVVQVVVLEHRRAREKTAAVLDVFGIERGQVTRGQGLGRQVVLQVAGAGRHVPQARAVVAPPVAADLALDVLHRLARERQGREELALLAAIDVFGEAVDLGDDAANDRGVAQLLVQAPEVLVVLCQDALDSHLFAAPTWKNTLPSSAMSRERPSWMSATK